MFLSYKMIDPQRLVFCHFMFSVACMLVSQTVQNFDRKGTNNDTGKGCF